LSAKRQKQAKILLEKIIFSGKAARPHEKNKKTRGRLKR
jgi:hypothetical protein